MAVAVFVLQTLAVERGAPGGAAQEEAARLHVARRPRQVADPLEAEHRVIDIERDHDAVVRRIRRRRRDPGTERARLVNALLQELPVRRLAVIHHLVLVDRNVFLAFGCVDADLAEQAFHAERAGFIGKDRNNARPDILVAQQLIEHAHERLRGRYFAALGRGGQHGGEHLKRGYPQRLVCVGASLGQVAAQRLATLLKIKHLG